MPVQALSYPSLIFDTVSGTKIDGITREVYDSGVTLFRGYPTGWWSPEFVTHMHGVPTFSLTSYMLKTLLSYLPYSKGFAECFIGHQINMLAATCPTRFGTTQDVHTRAYVPFSFWMAQRLTATPNEPASLEVMICPVYDGTNRPVTWVSGVAITTYTLTFFDELYVLGPVLFGDSLDPINGVQSVTIDFGIQVERQQDSGEPWDSWVTLKNTEPLISVEFLDDTFMGDNPYIEGGRFSAAAVYLQRLSQAQPTAGSYGGRWEASQAKHIALTTFTGHYHIRNYSANGVHDPFRFMLEMAPIGDSTNYPIGAFFDVEIPV